MAYGTVARYRVRAGQEAAFMEQMKAFESAPPKGWIYTTLFRSDGGSNDIWMSTVFESEEAYRENAGSPAMDERYRAMREHLDGDPEWHDGQVIHEAMRGS